MVDCAHTYLVDVLKAWVGEERQSTENSARAESVVGACQRDAGRAFSDMMKEQDDESNFVLEEDEVRNVLASTWKQKRHEVMKEGLGRGVGRSVKQTAVPAKKTFLAEMEELKSNQERDVTVVVQLGIGQENYRYERKITKEKVQGTTLRF